eukprot:TRINITY_DN54_c0_g1_i1.p1 TRINITY_DN54_c0_g1~~TRINITY_DN54_c0_g1_i1.p1  ORF type:complete len:292 (-),score=99.54 TRINITY_DN54_c0_g1_i1:326-1075(-)
MESEEWSERLSRGVEIPGGGRGDPPSAVLPHPLPSEPLPSDSLPSDSLPSPPLGATTSLPHAVKVSRPIPGPPGQNPIVAPVDPLVSTSTATLEKRIVDSSADEFLGMLDAEGPILQGEDGLAEEEGARARSRRRRKLMSEEEREIARRKDRERRRIRGSTEEQRASDRERTRLRRQRMDDMARDEEKRKDRERHRKLRSQMSEEKKLLERKKNRDRARIRRRSQSLLASSGDSHLESKEEISLDGLNE